MKKLPLRKIVLLLVSLGVILFIAFFIFTSILIGKSVKENCREAQSKYQADLPTQAGCVEVLIAQLEDENSPYRDRNSAIWVLGQLGDSRALSTLEKYYTGDIPDREPWNEMISQYELKKAINLVSGSFNATHFVWRHDLP